MEQAEKGVKKELEEQEAIRKYLLGALSDKALMRRIEEKILLDDDFVEKLAVAEDHLIDEYLDGSLAPAEQKSFVQFFLNLPERKQKLRIIRNLREYAANSAPQTVKEFPKQKAAFFDWRKLISLPSFRLAAAAILILLFGFIIWRGVFYQSDVDKGLAQLQIGVQNQRLTESRTTLNSDYAPLIVTRGDKDDAKDKDALRLAELHLSQAAKNTDDAEAQYALGLFYLAEKNFDKALERFNLAVKLKSDNAKLYNDIGAAYLEKAKLDTSEVSVNINLSIQNFDRALELNPNLLEALFNKALALEKSSAASLAREAWEKYLEKDSTSKWADEARRKIKELDLRKSQNLNADELEKAFLTAAREKNNSEAIRLISQNRELVKQKYLPQKLAMSFLKSSGDEKSEYLQALTFAGEIEEKNFGDLFAKDLAAFYGKLSDKDFELIKQAQEAMVNSFQKKPAEALDEANRARQIFLQTGDIYEAKLCEFIIVYFLIKDDKTLESIEVAKELNDYSRQKNYKWLHANTLFWLAGGQRSVGDRTRANENYKYCLDLAKEIDDTQIYQKVLVSYAKQRKFVGQNSQALNYLQQAFDALGSAKPPPLREKWRTYSESIEILASQKLFSLAKVISVENTRIANDSGDSSFIASSLVDAGIAHAQAGDFDDARIWLNQAIQNAEAASESADRTENLAKSLLTFGYMERRLGNHAQAAEFYDRALNTVANKKVPYFLYEIEKARLLTDISLNKEAQIEEQITKTVNLAEKYRKDISDEQQNNSFFNNNQDIYDIAVGYESKYSRNESAYNFLEKSNARSSLNWLKKGVNVKADKEKLEIIFKEAAEPLPLNEIRAQMPERVQILQYAVLDDKVLIWLISKDNFTVVSSEIKFEQLKEKVIAYTRLVSSADNQKPEETKALSRELYDILIAPAAAQLDPSRDICLIPQKILFHLPFAALTAPDDKPFLSQFNFSLASSANVFLLFTEKARQKSALTEESLLSVGNPRFDRTEYKDLEDLPEAEDEAQAIRQYYSNPQTQTLIGAAATKEAVKSSLKDAEVINFAVHYLVKNGSPLDSGLLLTKPPNNNNTEEGILTNKELMPQSLPQAKLVVLSACGTGVEQYYNGEGLVGLSNTFLKAGAPLVVASQWQVDSRAAAQLMKKFHQLRRQGKLSTTAALRRAQLEMMQDSGGEFSQPYFWAAFATYGGYAEF